MKLDIKNIRQNIVHKFILLCMMTIFPLLISLFLKNVFWSYLTSFLLVLIPITLQRFYNFPYYVAFEKQFSYLTNKNESLEIENALLKIESMKENLNSLHKSLENIDNGVLIIDKIIVVKQTVKGKSKIIFFVINESVENSLRNKPNLISHPKKLIKKFKNHQIMVKQ